MFNVKTFGNRYVAITWIYGITGSMLNFEQNDKVRTMERKDFHMKLLLRRTRSTPPFSSSISTQSTQYFVRNVELICFRIFIIKPGRYYRYGRGDTDCRRTHHRCYNCSRCRRQQETVGLRLISV